MAGIRNIFPYVSGHGRGWPGPGIAGLCNGKSWGGGRKQGRGLRPLIQLRCFHVRNDSLWKDSKQAPEAPQQGDKAGYAGSPTPAATDDDARMHGYTAKHHLLLCMATVPQL